MKIEQKVVEVSVSGVESSQEYQVATNAKMMGMLSDQLYKYKVKAVNRELYTNAWDAHVDAGTTSVVPEVYLPCQSNDYTYTLRDYGTGMNRETMERIYRRYGLSTKTHSNEFNGQMGIGSKSPFAYTTAFTTTSYYNGKKFTYINATGENGVFTLNFMSEEETDKPNGLEVSFICKPEDQSKFADEAKRVLHWLPVRFDVYQFGRQIKDFYEPIEYDDAFESDDDTWAFRKGNGYGYKTPYAIMGYVEYPIDPEAFEKSERRADVSDDWYQYYGDTNYKKLLKSNLELRFEIGEIEFDISREGLQYTPKTIETIKNKLDEIWVHVKNKVNTQFDNCKNLWEANILYSTLKSNSIGLMLKFLDGDAKFNDVKLQERLCLTDSNLGKVMKFYYGTTPRGNTKEVRRTDKNLGSFRFSDNIRFFENDMSSGAYASVSYWLEGEVAKASLPNPSTEVPTVFLLTFSNDQQREDCIEYLGCDPSMITKASTLTRRPRAKRGFAKTNDKVFTFNKQQYGYNRDFWTPAEVNIGQGGIYAEINGYCYVDSNGNRNTPKEIKSWIERIEALGIKIPVIHGMKSSICDKYKKSKRWIDLETWCKQRLDRYVEEHGIIDKYIKYTDLKNNRESVEKLQKLDLPEDSAISKTFCGYEFSRNNSLESWFYNLDRTRRLNYNWKNQAVHDRSENGEVSTKVQEIFDRYELLRDLFSVGSTMQKTINYINLVDKSLTQTQGN